MAPVKCSCGALVEPVTVTAHSARKADDPGRRVAVSFIVCPACDRKQCPNRACSYVDLTGTAIACPSGHPMTLHDR